MESEPRRAARLLGAAAVCLLLPGCLYSPSFDRRVKSGRGAVDEDVLAQFASEHASRADVLFRLGEPAERRDDDRLLLYRWQFIQGNVVIGGPGGGASIDVPESPIAAVLFDDDGRVIAATVLEPWLLDSADDRLAKWLLDSSPASWHQRGEP